ncbi:hypothetical protein OG259_00195 [Streptomyces sp. NBC_00250]|uniref:hypothetical protein n=1 Tax=Streptomyces sp. NBC_00250 TaxID=2903641 RepID=UPI002E2819A7|nr:hypothetical protein [Streptomyces sp. NBC_00250]
MTIDDAQHIDPSSKLVIDRLLRHLADAPLGLVLSHTTDGVRGGGHAAMVEEMLQPWADDGVLARRQLDGLPADAIYELVRRVRPTASLAFSEKLARLTDGRRPGRGSRRNWASARASWPACIAGSRSCPERKPKATAATGL